METASCKTETWRWRRMPIYMVTQDITPHPKSIACKDKKLESVIDFFLLIYASRNEWMTCNCFSWTETWISGSATTCSVSPNAREHSSDSPCSCTDPLTSRLQNDQGSEKERMHNFVHLPTSQNLQHLQFVCLIWFVISRDTKDQPCKQQPSSPQHPCCDCCRNSKSLWLYASAGKWKGSKTLLSVDEKSKCRAWAWAWACMEQ